MVPVQPKLVVGSTTDPAEREADRMADRALASLMRSPAARSDGDPGSGGDLASEIAAGSKIARRTAVVGAEGGGLDSDTECRIQAATGGGQALPDSLQQSMGGAFGADFSGVRLHVGPESDQLNERIQARAFTVGSDVFVRRSDYSPGSPAGQHLIAHELAHTVQQGGAPVQRSAPEVIRRNTAMQVVNSVRHKLDTSRGASLNMFDPDQFTKATYTRFHKRGAAVKAVDKYLAIWVATKPTEYANLRKLALQIQYACEQWILDHSAHDTADGAPMKRGEEASNEWLIDPARKGRFAGMVAMLEATNKKITYLNRMLDEEGSDSAELLQGMQNAGDISKEHKKLQVKYEGDPASSLAKLGTLVDMAAPNAGDSSEIEMAFRWPVEPSGVAFVGGTLRLKAQNSSPPGSSTGAQAHKNLLARMEVVFTFGAQGINIGKIQAEIGGYIESSAKTGRECMILMSYALFRKFRESYVMPRGATNYLWGGRTGKFGALKAERWGREVESEVIGENTGAYVQTGVIGALSGDVKAGNDTIGGGIAAKARVGSGTRYDKESIESVKQLGARNQKRKANNLSSTQKQLGKDVRFREFEIEGNIGPFNGTFSIKHQWQTAKAGGAIDGHERTLVAAEIEFKAGAKVPNVGGDELGERIAGWATEGVRTLVSKVRAVVEAKADKSDTRPALTQAQFDALPVEEQQKHLEMKTEQEAREARNGSLKGEGFGTVMDGLDQLRNIKGIESLANPGASPTTWLGGGADSTLKNNASFVEAAGKRSLQSTVGLQIAIGGNLIEKKYMLSINFEKAREFKIPMFLDITQKATSRLVAFTNDTDDDKWRFT